MLHVDLTRLLASIGIVLHHSIEFFVPMSDRQWLTEKTMGLALFVDLFFVISGFVIAYVYHDRALSFSGYLKFLQRRAGRLLPLHWITLLGAIIIWCAFLLLGYGGSHAPSFRVGCIAETTALIHSFVPCGNQIFFNGVSWSISTEMVMYVVVFPLLALAAARFRWLPAGAVIVALALLAWFYRDNSTTLSSWVEIEPLLRTLPSFCFGAAVYYRRDLIVSLPAPKVVFVASAAALLSLMLLGAPHLIVLLIVYVVAVSAVASDLKEKPGPFVRRYGPFGQLTYSIYMWHGLFILVLMNAVGDKLLQAQPALMALLAVVCWASIFAGSYISFFYIESPARRWVDELGRPSSKKKVSSA